MSFLSLHPFPVEGGAFVVKSYVCTVLYTQVHANLV